MGDWWNGMVLFQKIMVCIATPATLIVLLQFLFVLFGFGGDDSFDSDSDSFDVGGDADSGGDMTNNEGLLGLGGLKIVSVRTALAFLSVGGWVAMALNYSMPVWSAGLIGAFAGAVMAVLIAVAFHFAMKLENTGNIDYGKAVGKTATVYIRIPGDKKGKGKIQMTLEERFVEIDAVTAEPDIVETGMPVTVVSLIDANTVEVKKA